ncbi:toxin Doc [Streptomyces sp. NPDC057705]|uniref:toxin Doc n=1 Tax=Streptomyces sp. NPDC057705 TaxID=3346222 RepID=UPI0036A198AC
MELRIDIRWLLDRQEELLGKDLGVLDYSGLVAAVARHRVNTPAPATDEPDTYWRAAALLEQIVLLLRPLPARNEYFGYGVAVAYIRASGKDVDTAFEPWRDLITDIRALRLTVYEVADRLRTMPPGS